VWEFPCSEYLKAQKNDQAQSFALSKRIGYDLNMKITKECMDPTWIQV